MAKEGFSNLIIVAVVAILVVGVFGYYLGSKSAESAAKGEIIVPEDKAAVPEEKPAETPIVEEVKAKEWIVEIKNYSFIPKELTINVNDRITWINKDVYSHKVMADHAEFVSRPLQTLGANYSFIFIRAGTYQYRCGVHGDAEKATIIVK